MGFFSPEFLAWLAAQNAPVVMPLPAPQQSQKLELLTSALNRPVVIAYGRHIVGGNVMFQNENADKTVSIMVGLGEGEWEGPEVIWVNGVAINLADTSTFHFHPGLDGQLGVETDPTTRNAKICSFFPAAYSPQLTFARTAYAAFKLTRTATQPGPGFDIRGVYKTLRMRAFDASGTQTAYAYSANPAWCALDLILRRYLMPHTAINAALPQSVKDRIDFAAWKDWADYCDALIVVNGQNVKRFECHFAFVDPTDLQRALEMLLLHGRGFVLERNGKIAGFADKPRSALATLGMGDVVAGSFALSERDMTQFSNKFTFDFRVLDSGAGDPKQDFQQGQKIYEDEDLQDSVGKVVETKIDIGDCTLERAERLLAYTGRTTLDRQRQAALAVMPDVAGGLDLLPGDYVTVPLGLDYKATADFEIIEISDLASGERPTRLVERKDSIFVDGAGVQPSIAQMPNPGAGLPIAVGGGNFSYRPLTNPLTGHDAGGSATVPIAAFTMRIAGLGDFAINSSSGITGLSLGTLYFIYYDDPAPAGGTVTFVATTTKETALAGAGRFFVGSIVTPAAGASDTLGNNDGGVGAQQGGAAVAYGTASQGTSGSGANPFSPLGSTADGNTSSKGTCTQNSSGAATRITILTISGFQNPASGRTLASLILKIRSAVPTNNATGGNAEIRLEYSLNGGSTWTTIFDIITTGNTRGDTVDAVALSLTQNIPSVQVREIVDNDQNTAGSIVVDFNEAWIEAGW